MDFTTNQYAITIQNSNYENLKPNSYYYEAHLQDSTSWLIVNFDGSVEIDWEKAEKATTSKSIAMKSLATALLAIKNKTVKPLGHGAGQ